MDTLALIIGFAAWLAAVYAAWDGWRRHIKARVTHVELEAEERLAKRINDVDAKVHALDKATTAELKAMKQAYDRFNAKEAAHAYVDPQQARRNY